MMEWRRRTAGGPRAGYRGPGPDAADGAGRRALRGAVLAALSWVALARLGLFDVVGLSELQGLPIGALVGALLGWLRWTRVLWLLGALATALLIVVTATPLVRPLVVALAEPPASVDAVRRADAILVLSASITGEGRLAGQAPERLLHGLALARATGRPLVVSALAPEDHPERSSRTDQRALAALAGVDAQLEVIDSVASTRDEALRAAALARARGWRTLAVVTSPLHARRACATVARTGVAVVCASAPSRELNLGGANPIGGTEERARAFGLWAYEMAAWALYRARGWV
jgi:uncharacterized SAM-binding protein YcdF (DUF218 family)